SVLVGHPQRPNVRQNFAKQEFRIVASVQRRHMNKLVNIAQCEVPQIIFVRACSESPSSAPLSVSSTASCWQKITRCVNGVLQITVTLEKPCFRFGEMTSIVLDVSNASAVQVSTFTIKLNQVVRFGKSSRERGWRSRGIKLLWLEKTVQDMRYLGVETFQEHENFVYPVSLSATASGMSDGMSGALGFLGGALDALGALGSARASIFEVSYHILVQAWEKESEVARVQVPIEIYLPAAQPSLECATHPLEREVQDPAVGGAQA
ncbi:hypothetical protein CYMTET_28127, partial [Cymbomonas tetramitiformis]